MKEGLFVGELAHLLVAGLWMYLGLKGDRLGFLFAGLILPIQAVLGACPLTKLYAIYLGGKDVAFFPPEWYWYPARLMWGAWGVTNLVTWWKRWGSQ